MATPQFLENMVILCFKRHLSEQKSVIRLKSNILPSKNFLPPPNFWAGYATGSKIWQASEPSPESLQ